MKNLRPYGLWWSDFLTEFKQGAIRGLLPGTGVGGVAVAQTDTTDVQTLTWAGFGYLAVTAATNGLVNAVMWARTNPIPNPFREPSTP